MKKRRLILIFSICALLIAAVAVAAMFVFRSETTKYSFDKLKCDYISDVAYNDTYIVGKDGGFYLWRDGKSISDKYSSISSVNDFYGDDISAVLCSKDSHQKIYDLYIAKKADTDGYFFINSAKEEYTLAGSDYSLTEVYMPVLVFTNNSNGCKALVNLDALNSGLSSFSNGYIYPNEFNSGVEIFTKEFSAHSSLKVCDYVIAKQENEGTLRYLAFSDMGKLIVSTDRLETITVYDDSKKASVFFLDHTAGSIYSQSGELIASDIKDTKKDVTVFENYAVALSQSEGRNIYTCFGTDKRISISSADYDLSTFGITDGCIYVKDIRHGVYNVISLFLDGTEKYDRIIGKDGYLLARDQSSSRYAYLSNRGEFLFEHAHGDLILDRTLSDKTVHVFEETSENSEGVRELILAMPDKDCFNITLSEASSFERAVLCGTQEYTGYGVFLEKETFESGEVSLRVHTPFEKTSSGEQYNKIDIFKANDIIFALGANYTKGYYDIIDLPSNSVVQRTECEEDDFAKLSFELIDQKRLVYDASRENGTFPIVMLAVKKNVSDLSDAGNRKVIALYRNSTYGNKGFDYAKLNAFELGSAVLDEGFGSFDKQRYFSVREASTETLFTVTEEYALVRVATVYGRIKDVIADCTDPDKKYIISRNDAGYLGLYDIEGGALLSHYYTDIRFVDNDRIGASINGAYGVIRYIDGKMSELFDFKYADLRYFGEGTLLLTEASGSSLVYRNSGLALDEDVLGGKTLINYVEGQNGYERQAVIILAAGDELYIDEIEGSAPVELDTLSSDNEGQGRIILNARAKLVYYYRGDELVGKDVVYPTASFEDTFLNNDIYTFDTKGEGNWYCEKDDDTIGAALSKEDIISSQEHFITLYYH